MPFPFNPRFFKSLRNDHRQLHGRDVRDELLFPSGPGHPDRCPAGGGGLAGGNRKKGAAAAVDPRACGSRLGRGAHPAGAWLPGGMPSGNGTDGIGAGVFPAVRVCTRCRDADAGRNDHRIAAAGTGRDRVPGARGAGALPGESLLFLGCGPGAVWRGRALCRRGGAVGPAGRGQGAAFYRDQDESLSARGRCEGAAGAWAGDDHRGGAGGESVRGGRVRRLTQISADCGRATSFPERGCPSGRGPCAGCGR